MPKTNKKPSTRISGSIPFHVQVQCSHEARAYEFWESGDVCAFLHVILFLFDSRLYDISCTHILDLFSLVSLHIHIHSVSGSKKWHKMRYI